jgi:chromosome segregation ATPase
VAVPLTMITFYLRSLREQQSERQASLSHRLDSLEAHTDDLRSRMIEFERGYATKEEWLRELISARGQLDRLKEQTIRLEAAMLATPRLDGHRADVKHVPDDSIGASSPSGSEST